MAGSVSELSAALEDIKIIDWDELQQRLDEYYKAKVMVRREELSKDRRAANHISKLLADSFNSSVSSCLKGDVELQGSVRDDLMIRNGGDFDYLFTLRDITKNNSNILKGTEPGRPDIPVGYTKIQYAPSAAKDPADLLPEDVLTEQNKIRYISPVKLKQYLIGKFQKALNKCQGEITNMGFKILPCSAGGRSAALTYTIERVGENGKSISIDIVPAIRNNVAKQPKPEELEKLSHPEGTDLIWRDSFSYKEKEDSERLSEEHKKCVKIVKAIKSNGNSQLAILSSYHFKMLAIRLCKDRKKKWSSNPGDATSLAKLFVSYIDELIKAVDNKELQSLYIKMNLLNFLSDTQRDNIVRYLIKRKRKDFVDLVAL